MNVVGVLNAEGQSKTQIGNNYSINFHNYPDSSLKHCLADLLLTDPRDDNARIEQTKGGLLKDSYKWILHNTEFQQWQEGDESRLLWIKGDPGKGKTMLLCGILNELWPSSLLDGDASKDESPPTDIDATSPSCQSSIRSILSFFFCQATDSRLNTAVGILRGLLFLMLYQKPCLFEHIQDRYDYGGQKFFEGPNAFFGLSQVFQTMLHDPRASGTCLVIDALDECETGLLELLDLISQEASQSSGAKWIISSRFTHQIEQSLCSTDSRMNLSLELNAEHISHAVDIYIDYKTSLLPSLRSDETLQVEVRDEFRRKADGTFLWVALVLEELRHIQGWAVLSAIRQIPSGLTPLYDRKVEQMNHLDNVDKGFCQLTLSTVTAAYRPLHLRELGLLAALPPNICHNIHHIERLSNMCGHFSQFARITSI